MDDIQLSSILVAMVRSAPVLIFAALGGLFAGRSGIEAVESTHYSRQGLRPSHSTRRCV